MKYSYINKFKIKENWDLIIQFDNKNTYTYKWVTDLYFNKTANESLPYTIVDYFTYKISDRKKEYILWLFPFKYSEDFYNSEIKWKKNFLQIEWSLTIYAIYSSLEKSK